MISDYLALSKRGEEAEFSGSENDLSLSALGAYDHDADGSYYTSSVNAEQGSGSPVSNRRLTSSILSKLPQDLQQELADQVVDDATEQLANAEKDDGGGAAEFPQTCNDDVYLPSSD